MSTNFNFTLTNKFILEKNWDISKNVVLSIYFLSTSLINLRKFNGARFFGSFFHKAKQNMKVKRVFEAANRRLGLGDSMCASFSLDYFYED